MLYYDTVAVFIYAWQGLNFMRDPRLVHTHISCIVYICIQRWVHCYRRHGRNLPEINTNNGIESLHKSLKTYFKMNRRNSWVRNLLESGDCFNFSRLRQIAIDLR